ncbi:hypothetical protein [Flavobacterium aciduliphilum]|uniref:Uncharacterized protein n=1 Tax=Flavobacterium aciduliphilum TaxID=1101402 RepID=A0A328YU43_9FLAO|nr:hypothetical protein [Flavobacterium aciduliphilum]RAR74077.1 hypothetical protein CLV55_1024 [Flavobacterium aciduliphilum]
MKTLLLKLTKVSLLLFFLILTSCEKDLYDDTLKKESKIKVENFSLKNLKENNINNQRLFEAVKKVKKASKKNIAGKIVYDSEKGIYFDDEKGVKVSKEDYESYTFKILNSESEKIENLLFTKNYLQQYDIYKVKYDFTEEELKTLSPEELKQRQIEYYNITNEKMEVPELLCVEFQELVDNGELHGADSPAQYEWVTNASYCFWTGGIGGGGSDAGASGGVSGSGGSSGGEGGGGNGSGGGISAASNPTGIHIITLPVHGNGIAQIQQSFQELINSIKFTLTVAQTNFLQIPVQHNLVIALTALAQSNNNDEIINWLINQAMSQGSNNVIPIVNYLNSNPESYDSISEFLTQNNYSQESINLVNQMINLSISNGSTFTLDSSINSNNAQVFNNVQEFQNSIIKTGNGFDIQSATLLNEVLSSVKFQINNVGTNLQIDIKQKLTPTYRVSNLTTQLVGIASFLNSTLTNYTVNNSPMGTIKIDVYDTVSMNITVYGYGIVVNQPYHITVIIDSSNGQIISSFINP